MGMIMVDLRLRRTTFEVLKLCSSDNHYIMPLQKTCNLVRLALHHSTTKDLLLTLKDLQKVGVARAGSL